MDELTKLYSPSVWVKGGDPEKVLNEFYSDTKNSYDSAKEGKVHEEDLPYGDEERQKFDTWGEVKDKLLIILHGGYWQEGTRKDCLSVVAPAHIQGFAVASLGYGLSSAEHPLSCTVDDVIRGVEFLLKSYPQVETLAIAGHSAGAHLAFHAATRVRSEKIKGLILIAGVYQLDELVHTQIGKAISLTEEEARKNNCDHLLLQGLPLKTTIILGPDESPKLVEQNRNLAEATKEIVLKDYPDVNHFTALTNLNKIDTLQSQDFREFLSTL
ncbi:unnamed protein product [Caenorhabditis auriculariae]|uniref:BD-FAE-like domain-containing protein n=1 Tax=Caenorhabditis auriculariae TaxID=2777116 RepID=A0A8S1HW82_9PELO|nr:unnamed protein product [Caenorhabditis auriculariae]